MKKHNIKYTKNVLWLKSFVDSTKDIVPLHKITNIKGYRVRRGCEERAYGSTYHKLEEDKYSINLKLQELIGYMEYKGCTISIILDTLAHELAHVAGGWEHTPKHYKLTSCINLIFSTILEKNDIIDTSKRIKIK